MKISNCLIHRIKHNKITIRQQLLEDHTLKGKNRESSIKRPPDILYQGTEKYESSLKKTEKNPLNLKDENLWNSQWCLYNLTLKLVPLDLACKRL